jgi:hypothetical protein
MSDNNILKRNLLALSSRNPELAAKLSDTGPDNSVKYITSKTGLLIPAQDIDNRLFPFHSKFDPAKEGLRYLESSDNSGFIVFLGMGAGYHIEPFLNAKHISNILVIEKDIGLVRSIFEKIDMRSVLMNPRIKILVDTDSDQVSRALLHNYHPTLAGNLKTITLQARILKEKEYFAGIVDSIKNVINRIADDYTVQSQFGKRWFINTLSNLKKAEESTLTIKPVNKVLVTGAGPSLEIQIPELKKLKKDSFLIATDTSLPFLLKNNILPDLVISIDCQQITYHHFLNGYPENIPLILDLASPPVLTRLSDKLLFFSSGHPFSQYAANHLREFPVIDTSGGNVSHAAVSLASFLGAKEIYLFGIDFSYPEGKSYARGTYIYPYFKSLESRTQPLESQFFTFLFRNQNMFKEKTGDVYRYTTKPMINYKERMERAVSELSAKVIPVNGRGVPLLINKNPSLKKYSADVFKSFFSQGACKQTTKEFLKNYLSGIKELPEPEDPVGAYLEDLSNKEKSLWLTQFPAATAIASEIRKNKKINILPSKVLKKALKWTILKIRKYLK